MIAVDNDQFEKEEAQRRFEAALRGARAAEPHPMKEIPRKRAKSIKKSAHTNEVKDR